MNYESTIPSEDVAIVDDTEARATNRRRLIIAAVVVVALLLAYIGYNYFVGAGAVEDDSASQAPTVTVMAPGKQQVIRTINATGTLAARREIAVSVVGEGGRVTNVYVDAGDWVKQGQIMASIDRSVQSQQAAGLEASVGVSRADLNLAQSNLDRAMQLVDRGFISKADIDRLTATRDAAAARVRVAQAQFNESRARNSRLSIVAPKAGFVLERNVEPGQTVTQGSGTLFLLAQDGEMELQAQLGEADLANVSVGTTTQVTPVGADKTLTGQIWQISPIIDPQTRQGIARIALGYDSALRPGGFANARIESGTSDASVLPESAVLNDSKGSFVYIIGPDNKAIRRDVVVGSVSSAGLSITSGLTGNEKVVLRAGGFLNPGETVRPEVQKKAGGA
ncbi:MAG: efflux RND transporter periplasmic adaptor subunit [Sphingomonadales bacterium]|nr:efflux RND transporter periplasmic adaptor subunit [Sphingomonadales bacterium]PIX66695.1 MAG: efflux RND transporter periplasmic adaptor subunit [Sphingomonadales bacterium CG_4_10_14_3_um_filter_58_15]NCO48515.1 efflux RND transporter periplasmic adaptor subunit [Sphingomonadales bacterium]NCO99331.1 efflux RND transporter periplasmic adaptor subunit [Sphingomonadales bacterium]NCP27890.1 efflux RND transporter periplasmic adaptor subunit [Sphingomonadales bacterium]